MSEAEWLGITNTENLRFIIMRLFKMTVLKKDEGEMMVIKLIAEITTIAMRLEQNLKNNGKDEIRVEKALKQLAKCYKKVRVLTNYQIQKMELQEWMTGLVNDMEKVIKRHE